MKRTKQTGKLVLDRTTVKQLSSDELPAAAGGMVLYSSFFTCGITMDCTKMCTQLKCPSDGPCEV